MSTPAPTAPKRAGITLTALVLGALVSNINLAIANIALPDIGRAFDASQTSLNLVAIGCTLGLAMSVLYLGAIGDRYGRKLLLVLGMGLTVPFSLLAAFAPNIEVLIGARILTGIAAGMAFPTTLALITALWGAGPARIRAIALWSGIGGGGAILGPVIGGAMLTAFWWGSVFLIAIPLAILTFFLVLAFVPAHVNESTAPVDNVGGVLSVLMIAALVYGLGTISAPGRLTGALIAIGISIVLAILFVIRQTRAAHPLYNLHYARRRLFWVPTIAGMIVFGSLMGSMFIGQQFLQNVLQYSTLSAGLAVLPSAIGMILAAPISARLDENLGSRLTLLVGYVLVIPAFILMLFAWGVDTPYWQVGLAYVLVGLGAGIAMTPASRSLTSSVPVDKVGMASGTTDLQRDLGGSIMQAILGSLLTAGYALSFANQISAAPSDEAQQISQQTQAVLTESYANAAQLAEQYPQYQQAIITAARESFLSGANWAYGAAIIAGVIGAILVIACFPGKQGENDLLAEYAKQDAQAR